jgi:hypothetical protein
MGVHHKTASLVLDGGLSPVCHPSTAGFRLYHRQAVEAFPSGLDAVGCAAIGRPQKGQDPEEKQRNFAASTDGSGFGEIDASQADLGGRSLYRNEWFNGCRCVDYGSVHRNPSLPAWAVLKQGSDLFGAAHDHSA